MAAEVTLLPAAEADEEDPGLAELVGSAAVAFWLG